MRKGLKAVIITLIVLLTASMSLIFFAASAMSGDSDRALIASAIVAAVGAGSAWAIGAFRWPLWFLAVVASAFVAGFAALWLFVLQGA